MTRLIAIFFGAGLLRPAPGTWGTAAALPCAWVIHALAGFPGLVIATVLTFGLGWWATAVETRGKADHDPSEIVIDEVVGLWIALMPMSYGLWVAGTDPWTFPLADWIGAFILFRLFDIWKFGPIGWADRRGDALGVMLDDVIAGALAAVVLILGAIISTGVFGV